MLPGQNEGCRARQFQPGFNLFCMYASDYLKGSLVLSPQPFAHLVLSFESCLQWPMWGIWQLPLWDLRDQHFFT